MSLQRISHAALRGNAKVWQCTHTCIAYRKKHRDTVLKTYRNMTGLLNVLVFFISGCRWLESAVRQPVWMCVCVCACRYV